MIPTKTSIQDAHAAIAAYVHRTPVFTSQYLNKLTGAEVFFKCDNFQKIGAFKARGGLNAALNISITDLGKGICTHSSGNHAQAVAYAAKMLNTKAYVVMPENSTAVKVDAVRELGAEITFCEPTQAAREHTVESIVADTGAIFIHPYDNFRVIEGQATAAKELIEDVGGLEAIIAPTGGGGLLSGTCLASKYFGKNTTVYGAEPERVNDAWQSLKKGEIVPATRQPTVADGLQTSLGERTFPIISEHVKGILTVSEEEIIAAMKLVWERMKIIIEPSSAVPVAALIRNKNIFAGRRTGIIITGGNVDITKLPFC